jgi:tetratricopeptide (TPR) repeat protein
MPDIPSLPQPVINELTAHYNQGNFKSVLTHTDALIEQYPADFVLWNIRGASAAQLGNRGVAKLAFTKVCEIAPNYPEGFYNLGNLHKGDGNIQEAIHAFQKAVGLRPGFVEAVHALTNACIESERLSEALRCIEELIKNKGEDARTQLIYSKALRRSGEGLR